MSCFFTYCFIYIYIYIYHIDTITNKTRTFQAICEPGFWCIGGIKTACAPGVYGFTTGLSNPACSGPCQAGYYCPIASAVRDRFPCGGWNVFCPAGSGSPVQVARGFYSVLGADEFTRENQQICPKGYFCENGFKKACTAGKFGDREGLSTAFCSGWCKEGYACPEASLSSTQVQCSYGQYSYKGQGACFLCKFTSISVFDIYSPQYAWAHISSSTLPYHIPLQVQVL